MNAAQLFKDSKTDIKIIKRLENGLFFQVKNGRNGLSMRFGVTSRREGFAALCLNSLPLIKFHGDEYFCQTCQMLVSAGYGLDNCDTSELAQLQANLNAPFESLEISFEQLKLVLGLLDDGIYFLSDEELMPTDGDGHFFWTVTNQPVTSPGTCTYSDPATCKWGTAIPKFILPTQPPTHFDAERVKYYQEHNDRRAVAFYAMGYLCALLDGHHKAVAAALEGCPVKTILISPGMYLSRVTDDERGPDGGKLFFYGDLHLTEKELKAAGINPENLFSDKQLTEEEADLGQIIINEAFDWQGWPPEILATAGRYLEVFDLAAAEWAGDLSEQRLEGIVEGRERPETDHLVYIIKALFIADDPVFVDFCLKLYKGGCEPDVLYAMFPLLAKIRSAQVEDFFIDYVINDEGLRPKLTKIADEYLNTCYL